MKPTQRAGRSLTETVTQRALRLARDILADNQEVTFRLVVEDATDIAEALRVLGCRVTQNLFRASVLQVTPRRKSALPSRQPQPIVVIAV